MSLGAVDSGEADVLIEAWANRQPSRISDHGLECCQTAKAWLMAMDRSQLVGGPLLSGPQWLLERHEWGPSPWPLHWCEAVAAETLDCGASADLVRVVFTARGLQAVSVQLIQQFSQQTARQWSRKWNSEARCPDWIVGTLVYHEACAVFMQEERVKIWDPDGWWADPRPTRGYGSNLAIRIHTPTGTSNCIRWGELCIQPNTWQKLGE